MKTRIIFMDDFKNIKFNNFILMENSICKKYYKKFENEIIEIICCNDLNQVSKMLLNNMFRSILVIKEINNTNIGLIQMLYEKDVILAVGMVNCGVSCEVLNNIIYFPQLSDDNEIIDLDAFIFTINNKLFNIKNRGKYILFGKEKQENACGSIPIFILKRFAAIQNLKDFRLELHNKRDININDLSYIEDCIREYINDGSVLKINQVKNSYDKDNTYFFLCAQ